MNFAIHLIGELARPLSLTIRLFGNLFGEDVVIAILLGLGVYFTKWVPFQLPMYFLAVFTGFVQAMVFSILCCVYIASFVVHDDHGQGHGEHHDDHGHGHDHGVMERVSPAAPA
jgi:F-type H+-transporting ATPase subunit a